MDTARELIYSEGRERETSETNAVSHYSQGNSGGAPTLCTRPSVCHVPRRIAAAAAVSRERRTDGEINGETMQCASRARDALSLPSLLATGARFTYDICKIYGLLDPLPLSVRFMQLRYFVCLTLTPSPQRGRYECKRPSPSPHSCLRSKRLVELGT